MRICLIGKAVPRIPPKSGMPVTIYLHTLAEQLSLMGHSVDVICAPVPAKEKQKYNVIEVGKPRISSSNIYIQNLYELWFSLRLGLSLRKLCKKKGYDLVHFFENPATAFSALLFARKDMPPFIFSSGMPVSGTELTWGVQTRASLIWKASITMHSHVFKRMTRITTSSSQLKDVVVKHTRIDPARVTVTPFISAETDLFHPDVDGLELRRELGLSDDDLIVLCLAPVAPYKNQLSLVKAIPHIIQRHPRAKFLFVGEITREYYSQIQQFVQSNSLDEHVIFTGFIKNYADLPKYYSLADLHVLVSRAEGNLPKTILEAMSCGKAVVASSIPQNVEGAKRGDEIIFVDPYDVDAIANAINELLNNPDLRRGLGENARQTVIEYHAPEVVARGMVKVYEEVIAGKVEGGGKR